MRDGYKTRTIRIIKANVYRDIDDLTYKYAEASDIPSPKVENAIQSDVTENLDGHIMARNVEYRDSKMRSCICNWIADADSDVLVVTDALKINESYIDYKLEIPATMKDSLLGNVASIIHRYLVYGALYDWYGAGMGHKQADSYAKELTNLENEVQGMLCAVGVVKRPLQPFGPKNKFF